MGSFRMGAAFLAHEHGVPVVPGRAPRHVRRDAARPGLAVAGPPPADDPVRRAAASPGADESVREFAPRIKDAVAALLDEDRTTWWEARRGSPAGATPDPSGPDVAQWRRVWEQSESPAADATATALAAEPTGVDVAWRTSAPDAGDLPPQLA